MFAFFLLEAYKYSNWKNSNCVHFQTLNIVHAIEKLKVITKQDAVM